MSKRVGPLEAVSHRADPESAKARQLPGILHRLPRSFFALAIIMIVGAAFRFSQLGHVPHGYDEGYPAFDALRLLDGRQLVLIGQPSSVFLDNPPLMAYLQAVPLLFWRSLWAIYIFVAALNTVAIGFVYQTTRKLLNEPAALLAAFLFAISPWVVHYSRMPWVQGLFPLYTAVFAWGFWPLVVTKQGSSRRLFIAMLALTAMIQSYILGFAILFPAALLALLFFRTLPKRPFYAGALVLFSSLILFGIGLAQNEGRNSAKLQSFVSDNAFAANTQALEHAVRFVTGLDYVAQAPVDGDSFPRQAASRVAQALLSVALLAGGIQALLALRRDTQERRLAIVLLVWFFAPVLGLLFLPYLVHPHYLMLSLPAGHVLAAWGTLPLLRRRRPRLGITIVLLAIAALFWLNVQRTGQELANNPTGYGFNGWAVADIARVGQTIRELAPGDGYPRRIVADDNSPLLSGISATYVDTMSELEFPNFMLLPGQEPLLYVLLNHAPESTLLGPHQESFPERAVQLDAKTSVTFLRVSPYSREQALLLPEVIVDWTSDAGLTLLGYSLETPPPYRAGQELVAITYWRVEELHPDRAEWLVAPFIHVLNAEGQIMANVSSEGQWADRWEPGDVYIRRTIIPLPDYAEAGEHQLAFGLFDPLRETGFALHSPSGTDTLYLAPLHIDGEDTTD